MLVRVSMPGMAAAMVAVGVMVWGCGDEGKPNGESSEGGASGGGSSLTGSGGSVSGGAGAPAVPETCPDESDTSYTPAVLWITLPDIDDPDDVPTEDEPGALRVIEDHDGEFADPAAFATMPATLEIPITLNVRGSSSIMFDKKNFTLELRDDTGEQVDESLLGMPKESDWVLHGPYSDKTYLRNALTYWMGREIYRLPNGCLEAGRWNPRTRFAEIFINGDYRGLYVVTEKIKADGDRVDVDRPAASAAEGDVTGGYIVRREGIGKPEDGADFVSTVEGIIYTFHIPREPDLTVEQRDYIEGFMDDFESMMQGDSWNSPTEGYPAWLDVPVLLDYVLMTEFSDDVDGYFKSVYYVKQADSLGGKLTISPLWDFNIAFGNANYRGGDDPTHWVHLNAGSERSSYEPPGSVPYLTDYFLRFWGDEDFLLQLRCRWEELRSGPLSDARLFARIDAWVAQLAKAEQRDHERWPVLGEYVWPNPTVWNSYAEEIAYLKDFISERGAFLDEALPALGAGTCP